MKFDGIWKWGGKASLWLADRLSNGATRFRRVAEWFRDRLTNGRQ